MYTRIHIPLLFYHRGGCRSQKRMLTVLFHRSTVYSFESGSLTKPGARLEASKPPGILLSLSLHHSTGVTGMHKTMAGILHGF